MGLHVVIGAAGGVGSALTAQLRSRGLAVRAVDRTPRTHEPEIEAVTGDAADAARMREVCAGAEAVYHCVNPPFARWRAVFPATVEGVLAGATAAGARMVFADDTWMYGRVDAPMTETTPRRPVGEKGVLRAWLAETVLAAPDTVVGRAGELYGPGVRSVLAEGLFGAAVRGGPLRWIGALDQPLTPTYVGDFARVLATLGTADPSALGRVWHVPHPPPTTGREFVATVRAASEARGPLVTVPSRLARALAPVWPLAREGAQLVYQFEMPFVVDGRAFEDRFGAFGPTPYATGIAHTLDWYRREVATCAS